MLEIMRGTTPTVTCRVDANLVGYDCYLEFGQPNTPKVEVRDPQISYAEGVSTAVFTMTEEQTLSLLAGKIKAQLVAEKTVGGAKQVLMTYLVEVRVLDPVKPKKPHHKNHGC